MIVFLHRVKNRIVELYHFLRRSPPVKFSIKELILLEKITATVYQNYIQDLIHANGYIDIRQPFDYRLPAKWNAYKMDYWRKFSNDERMFVAPMTSMPRYINHKDYVIRSIALWRLEIGK